jgi:hypothetical protein
MHAASSFYGAGVELVGGVVKWKLEIDIIKILRVWYVGRCR